MWVDSPGTTSVAAMFRRTTSVIALLLLASACSAASSGRVATVDRAEPIMAAAPVDQPATRPVLTPVEPAVEPTEPAPATAPDQAPEQETVVSPEAPARIFGPGLSREELESHVLSLTVAEAWLAELEVEWDNGMTYSEIFRAWKAVSAETEPILASYDMPSEADAIQTRQLEAYYESVQGAHDEWQRAVDFIVTYITNYTPEILIQEAYWRVEDHLDEAALLREDLSIAPAEAPEIPLERFIDS